MSGRSILIAIALSGWLIVSIVVVMTVAYAGFIGIGVVGLLMWFICTIVDLELDGAVGSGQGEARRIARRAGGPLRRKAPGSAVGPVVQVPRRGACRDRHGGLCRLSGLGGIPTWLDCQCRHPEPQARDLSSGTRCGSERQLHLQAQHQGVGDRGHGVGLHHVLDVGHDG